MLHAVPAMNYPARGLGMAAALPQLRGCARAVRRQRSEVVGARTVACGQYIRQGDELLQVHSSHHFVRVVMTDHDLTRTRLQVGATAELRWTCEPLGSTRGIVREIRRSTLRYHVPVELTMATGGQIYARSSGKDAEADQPYLHVFLAAQSIPMQGEGGGLTAAVRFAAREETLGNWLRRHLLNFLHNWRMS